MDTIYIVEYADSGELIAFESKTDAICYVATNYLNYLRDDLDMEADPFCTKIAVLNMLETLTFLHKHHYIEDYVYITPIEFHKELK